MMQTRDFCGSYGHTDVVFLLQPMAIPLVDVLEKERFLQSGERHYSEMLGAEYEPSPAYLEAFDDAVTTYGPRLAGHVLSLARYIDGRVRGRIGLASLARAGTPIGVLLRRALARCFGRDVEHYSLSLIAGRGIDACALDHLRRDRGFADEQVVFVDGWTGKGVIGRALQASIADYNATSGARLDPTLFVIADLCGSTPAAATADDVLIPHCLLGATVSGLVSRSILNDAVIASGGFHGCLYYAEWSARDRSRGFVDAIASLMDCADAPRGLDFPTDRDLMTERLRGEEALGRIRARHGYTDNTLIKPGLGESIRALLRRGRARVIARDWADPELAPLRILCREKRAECLVDPSLPWRAVSLVAKV